jgi:uncharacterized protein YndB with AHSA1/START domain
MRIATVVEINAPVERVWPLVAEDGNIGLWMPDVLETTYPDGRPQGDPVGTRFEQRIREGGRVSTYQGEVTAYAPQSLLGVRLQDQGNFSTDVVYRLSRQGAGTRLDYTCDVVLKSRLARLMMVIALPMTWHIVKRHMRNLKRVAEAGGVA